MSIGDELLIFSKTRPEWQQDLIRRVHTQPRLSNDDVARALTNLKATEGLAEGEKMIPLAKEHLSQRTADPHSTTKLAAISNVQNANQLAPGQHLPFALDGITLIYGDNGSGKTGYSRIAKQLCRARRDKQEPLLGNVYKNPSGPAKAKVTFYVGNQQRQLDWEDGKPVPPELARISVFDASTAPLYADRQNEIQFLPLGLDVLPRLGRACENLAEALQADIDGVKRSVSTPLPDQIAGTAADALVQRLTLQTPENSLPSLEELGRASSWTGPDDERLLAIEKELQKLSEPAQAAAQCRRYQASINTLVQRLQAIDTPLKPESVASYSAQFEKARAARSAASIAARGQFEKEPLGSLTGNAAWRRLYEYAEKFSIEVYPGEAFPVTGNGRLCLLCQQPYDEAATQRMARFRAFMKDTSQSEAEREESKLQELARTVAILAIPTVEELQLQFAELSAHEPSFQPVGAGLHKYISKASENRTAVLGSLKGESSFDAVPELDASPLQVALDFAKPFEEKANKFDEAATTSSTIDALKREHKELLGRRQLSFSLKTIGTRLSDILTFHKLGRCKAQCDTLQISRKNSDFREKYVTADFKRQIVKEVENFGLTYLPIKIESKTEKGTSYIGVGLEKIGAARNFNILSEGEFRALALACFFAEIANVPNHDGIVVDDPVSSLDHRHMQQVAQRLVTEAGSRPQVIVFTHDLSFYYELFMVAAAAGIAMQRNWIQYSKTKGFGVVAIDDGPWQVKKTKERLKLLEDMLKDMPTEATVSPDDYAKHLQAFYTRLRETWERLVEERLLNGVSGRFQPGIMTQSLKGVSVTDDDYRRVFFAMKRVSEYSGHDRAAARQGAPPSKAAMSEELQRIREYEKELASRVEVLQKQRRKLEEPPAAVIVPGP